MIAVLYLTSLASAVPTGYLVQPIPRQVDAMAKLSSPPCGGIPKGKSHLLTEPGSLNPMTWLVREPAPAGNCSVHLSVGTDFSASYLTLFPVDNSADAEGWFACGRLANFTESKTFVFPEHVTCDSCTLQWVWRTADWNYYECVDVEIAGDSETGCFGKCLNGGVCVDKECLCTTQWKGQFCEKEINPEAASTHHLGMFLLLVVLLVVMAGLVYGIWYIRTQKLPRTTEVLFQTYVPFCMKERGPEQANMDLGS